MAATEMQPSLILFDRARTALAEAQAVDEVKDIRDQAEALRAYYKQRDGSLEMANQCAEIKLRAERRIGELLATRPSAQGQRNDLVDSTDQVKDRPTLADIGISRDQSSTWQAIARIPEPVFEEHIAVTKESGMALTTAGLLKEADPRTHHKGPDKSREAVAQRREKMRELAQDGYRPSAIAQIVGLSEQAVGKFLTEEGIETVEQRIGKTARIDPNRVMESLVSGAAPSEIAIAALSADWSQLDRSQFPEWIAGLTSAMNHYRRLRDRMEKEMSDGSRG